MISCLGASGRPGSLNLYPPGRPWNTRFWQTLKINWFYKAISVRSHDFLPGRLQEPRGPLNLYPQAPLEYQILADLKNQLVL